MSRMLLADLTWEEAAALVEKDPVVIVPLGSTEQHGPHLPLKVDIAAADHIARAVGEITGALVAPPLNFGFSELWHTYPGTISLRADTFKNVLLDVCHSLIRTGFRKIFLINGHNPNLIVMQTAAYELVDRYQDQGISVAAGTYVFMAAEKCNAIGENFRDGTHANEMETSIMMHLFRDEIRTERIAELGEGYRLRKAIAFDGGAMILNRWPDSQTYHGVYGNPALGSKEKGALYTEALIGDIAQFVRDFGAGKYDPVGKDGLPQDRS